jgi:hypothetical protein
VNEFVLCTTGGLFFVKWLADKNEFQSIPTGKLDSKPMAYLNARQTVLAKEVSPDLFLTTDYN